MYPATALAPSQDRVLALANLLVFLGQHQYPAERVVRTVDGSLTSQSEQWHMLVTTYLGPSLDAWQPASAHATDPTSMDAARVKHDPQLLFHIGALLGQLHALDSTGPVAELMVGPGLQAAAELAWASSQRARRRSSTVIVISATWSERRPTAIALSTGKRLDAAQRLKPCVRQ